MQIIYIRDAYKEAFGNFYLRKANNCARKGKKVMEKFEKKRENRGNREREKSPQAIESLPR
jgi:hypothetical protein